QHVEWFRLADQLHASHLADLRKASVSSDYQLSAGLVPAVGGSIAYAAHRSVGGFDQLLGACCHLELECRIALRLSNQHVDEARLWHVHDARVPGGDV